MCYSRKCLVFAGLGVMGIGYMLLISRVSKKQTGTYGKLGQNIDDGLKKTVEVLANTTAHVQRVHEQIKNRKQK